MGGCYLEHRATVSGLLLPEQSWIISSERRSLGRHTHLYQPRLSTLAAEEIEDNCSHGICFVCNNIFEPQISSAQLTSDLSLMTVHAADSSGTPLCSSSGKATSGEKLSDVCTGQGGAFFLSRCEKAR